MEFDTTAPDLVPTQLALAASRSNCQWRDVINEQPVHVFQIAKRSFARITCFGFGYMHQICDLLQLESPEALAFPVAGQPEGFRTTSFLGLVTLKLESGLLESVGSSDQCGGPGVRYTYRWANEAFSIIRVELSPQNCSPDGPWSTIWEAPQWSSPIPRAKDH